MWGDVENLFYEVRQEHDQEFSAPEDGVSQEMKSFKGGCLRLLHRSDLSSECGKLRDGAAVVRPALWFRRENQGKITRGSDIF
jgi:hypothetical protein